jgi:DNA polymerase III, delta subunit
MTVFAEPTNTTLSLEVLKASQPLVVQFFESALKLGTLSHGYVLTGNAIEAQYALALRIAQVLNCSEPIGGLEPCGQCRSCKWLAKNAHPFVTTITRLNFDPPSMPASEKDTQRTQISTGQIGYLLDTLSRKVGNEEYRIIIFTDATVHPTDEKSNILPPFDWVAKQGLPTEDDIGKNKSLKKTSKPTGSFQLKPLNSDVFSVQAVNRFLKSLEEPHPRTLFFFLTENESALLPTVVSRCQVVPFRSTPTEKPTTAILGDWFWAVLGTPKNQRINFYPLHAQFVAVAKESGGEVVELLQQLQRYLSGAGLDRWEQLFGRETALKVYCKAQAVINTALTHLQAKTNEGAVLQALILGLWEL